MRVLDQLSNLVQPLEMPKKPLEVQLAVVANDLGHQVVCRRYPLHLLLDGLLPGAGATSGRHDGVDIHLGRQVVEPALQLVQGGPTLAARRAVAHKVVLGQAVVTLL